MRKAFFLASLLIIAASALHAQQTQLKYLSGTDKDHTVNWEFFCTKGLKSGKWTTIPVPAHWEQQGFGGYNYGHDKNKHDEQGLYRYRFTADPAWTGKQVVLVFDGVMTDAEVKVNGQSAGPIHQGSFYRFQYNITSLIQPGKQNLLEVTVSKMSADSTVNRAERESDFWVFGGIYRPVYLKVLPAAFIERVAIDAKADGQFLAEVFAENIQAGDEVVAQVKTLKGLATGASFKGTVSDPAQKVTLTQSFSQPQTWNPEKPALYTVSFQLLRNKKVVHSYQQRFGFRTVEVRKGDGIYVNGTKVIMKGVNRHSFWPETGRTLSRTIHLMDIRQMKDMNMNAVRMSHYPPDVEFLDLCDSLGLFVLDELCGWQKYYGTPVGRKLVKETVIRDVNHPSILFWDNGNEGGFNRELDNDYALYDPQKRAVIHPWEKFSDIDTKHYPVYSYIEKANQGNDILMHTEMIHGLYDGGHGAALDDFWTLMKKNPRHAGGFLWVLSDEAIMRRDKKDSFDTDGNHAPDGIVGPHREKEGSYYTIKELWSPVQVRNLVLDNNFKGTLDITNEYHYTNLSACSFKWELISYQIPSVKKAGHTMLATGKASMALAPGAQGQLPLTLPAKWKQADALTFTAIDPNGHELYTWVFSLTTPAKVAKGYLEVEQMLTRATGNAALKEGQDGPYYTITHKGITCRFDTTTGYLYNVTSNGKLLPIGNGPIVAGAAQTLKSFHHYKEGQKLIIEAAYTGDAALQTKWTFAANMPAQLEYSYAQTAPANYYGITFQATDSSIASVKWLGDGPYRVWKNRRQGVTLDVWEKQYNNTITGETLFQYPEFKGYHANMYWATIKGKQTEFTVHTDQQGLFLQLLQPDPQHTKLISHVNPPFPQGGIGFLNAIAPIGTKFHAANVMGPGGQLNEPAAQRITGNLWFTW